MSILTSNPNLKDGDAVSAQIVSDTIDTAIDSQRRAESAENSATQAQQQVQAAQNTVIESREILELNREAIGAVMDVVPIERGLTGLVGVVDGEVKFLESPHEIGINVKAFGAVGDGITDDTVAIEKAIIQAALPRGGAIGAVVYFPTGKYLISRTIIMPNRVGLKGANGRGTHIMLNSNFNGDYMFHAHNGTQSMFGSWIKDFYIDARGKSLKAVVWSQAWQETSGMENVVIQFADNTQCGFLYTDGWGGAAFTHLRSIEIFGASSYPDFTGVKIADIGIVGGFILNIDGMSIAGTEIQSIVGIQCGNAALSIKSYHAEFCKEMCRLDNYAKLYAETWTGSFNDVGDMIVLMPNWDGYNNVLNLNNIIQNGARGNILKDNRANPQLDILRYFSITNFVYPRQGFYAYLSADRENAVGDNSEIFLPVDTIVYNDLKEFEIYNSKFMATKKGRYKFTISIGLIIPAQEVPYRGCNIKIGNNVIYDSNIYGLRTARNTVVVNSSKTVVLDSYQSISPSIIVDGGAKDVTILSEKTFIQCEFLG